MTRPLINFIWAAVCLSSLAECNGIMDGIYDEADENVANGYGFVVPATASSPGTIYIDATSYTRWTYINLADKTIDTLSVDDPAPEEWDFAVHRYDTKTNGGEVAVEGQEDWTPDEWTTNVIITDMSGMMDGKLEYQPGDYNRLLSSWLSVDKSTMPPIYSLSGKTYILRTKDGRKAALKLVNFMNGEGIKGYMTIDYTYPYK